MRRPITKALAAVALVGGVALASEAMARPGPDTGSVLDRSVGAVEQVKSRARYRDRLRPFRRSARSSYRYPTRLRPFRRSADRYRDRLRPLRRSTPRYPTRLRPFRARPAYRSTLRPQPRYRVRDRLQNLRRSEQERLAEQAARERAAAHRAVEQQRQKCEAWRRYQETERGVREKFGGGGVGGGRLHVEPPAGC
jgi:hypothetical protein